MLNSFILLVHEWLDALSVAIDRRQYLLIAALALGSLMTIMITDAALPRHSRSVVLLWPVISAVFLLPSNSQEHFALSVFRWGLTLLPLLLFLAASAGHPMFSSEKLRDLLLFGMMVAAVMAAMWGRNAGGRFDPPNPVLIAGVCLWIEREQYSAKMKAAVLVGLLALTYLSGSRISLILWLIAIVLVSVRRRSWGFGLLLGAGIAAIVGIALWANVPEQAIQQSVPTARWISLTEGADVSTRVRLEEISDAWREMRNWDGGDWLLGAGHGGTYEVWTLSSSTNVFDDGTAHQIHFGPLFMLFHYGLLGAAIVLCAILSVVRSVARFEALSSTQAFFTLSITLFVVAMFTHDILLNPLFAYSLGGFLAFRKGITAASSTNVLAERSLKLGASTG